MKSTRNRLGPRNHNPPCIGVREEAKTVNPSSRPDRGPVALGSKKFYFQRCVFRTTSRQKVSFDNFFCASPRSEHRALVFIGMCRISNENSTIGRVFFTVNASQTELLVLLNGSSYAYGHHAHNVPASPIIVVALQCNILEKIAQRVGEGCV